MCCGIIIQTHTKLEFYKACMDIVYRAVLCRLVCSTVEKFTAVTGPELAVVLRSMLGYIKGSGH